MWRALVVEHQRTRREALVQGASSEDLETLDREYFLLIDSAFSELQTAESLDCLSRAGTT